MHLFSAIPKVGIQPKALIQTPTAEVKQDESLQVPNSFFSL